jgi:hypothetical protein
VKSELGIPADIEAVAPVIVGVPSGPTTEALRKDPQILYWKQKRRNFQRFAVPLNRRSMATLSAQTVALAQDVPQPPLMLLVDLNETRA